MHRLRFDDLIKWHWEEKTNHMRYKILKVVLFFVVFSALYFICAQVLTPKWRYPIDREENDIRIREYEQLKTDPQVLFLGTSHVQYGVNPMQIYDETGITSFNLSLSGCKTAVAYCILKEALLNHQPQVVMLDVSTLYMGYSDYSYVRAMDIINDIGTRWELANAYADQYVNHKKESEKNEQDTSKEQKTIDEYFEGGKWGTMRRKAFLFTLSRLYGHHSRWNEINSYDFELMWPYAFMGKGYVYATRIQAGNCTVDQMNQIADGMSRLHSITEHSFSSDGESILTSEERWFSTEANEENLEWLTKIQKLCESEGIELILIKIPAISDPSEYDRAWTESRHDATVRLSKEKGLPFFDIIYDSDISLDISKDFLDGGQHCNYLGAKKISSIMGEYLANVCNITPKEAIDYEDELSLYYDINQIMDLETETDYLQYLIKLKNIMRKKDILIAAKGDGGQVFDYKKRVYLEDIGIMHYPYSDENNGAYLALLVDGMSSQEMFSETSVKYDCQLPDAELTLISRSNVKTDKSESLSSIMINGKEYSLNQEGVNLVIYDPETRCVIDSVAFTRYGQFIKLTHYNAYNSLINDYRYAKYNIYF